MAEGPDRPPDPRHPGRVLLPRLLSPSGRGARSFSVVDARRRRARAHRVADPLDRVLRGRLPDRRVVDRIRGARVVRRRPRAQHSGRRGRRRRGALAGRPASRAGLARALHRPRGTASCCAHPDPRRDRDLLCAALRHGRHDDCGRRRPTCGACRGLSPGNRERSRFVCGLMVPPRRVAVLALAFLIAACTAQVAAPRPSETPLATASLTASPRPTNATNDVIYLRSVGSGGVANILAIDARTGATLRTLPDGAASFDRSTLYAAEEKKGATQTVVRRMDFASARELSSFTIDGTYHAVWTDSGRTALSRDGRHLALSIYPYKLDGDWVTGFKVIDAGSGAIEATLNLKGQSTYSFVAMSPDGRSLFLNQFGEAATGMRVFDVPSSTLLPATAIAGAVAQGGCRR